MTGSKKYRIRKLEDALVTEGGDVYRVIWDDDIETTSTGIIVHSSEGDQHYSHAELKNMKRRGQWIDVQWDD